MCEYTGYEFGAGYLDSTCIDGKLYDADACDDEGNLYDPGEDIPCPMCRPDDAVAYWTERNASNGDCSKAKAAKMARSLVADIRANRGVNNMTEKWA